MERPTRADVLRAKLDVCKPAVAMAAHNPLVAKLAAQAGFDAIWGSGFELSASYAVPDASILPMGTHLEMMRAIGEAQDARRSSPTSTPGSATRSTSPTPFRGM